jgi:phospholipase/carboxylesterase
MKKVSKAGVTYRFRQTAEGGSPPLLLLHGLGGDEEVMWVFESALPVGSLAVAPRGVFSLVEGGGSWTPARETHLPKVVEFDDAVEAMVDLLGELHLGFGVPQDGWVWVGFSQGAGMAFAAACAPDVRPRAVVSLAGFVPDGFEARAGARLAGVPVYWGHGTKDDQVPVQRARRDVSRLRQAGLDVTYCEADVGHKLGADCLRGLKGWFFEGSARHGSPGDS